MQYFDTYINSSDLETITSFCSGFRNVIGPTSGIASYIDEEGVFHQAIGDPSKFYACLRAPFTVDLINGIDQIDQELGIEVLGSWA